MSTSLFSSIVSALRRRLAQARPESARLRRVAGSGFVAIALLFATEEPGAGGTDPVTLFLAAALLASLATLVWYAARNRRLRRLQAQGWMDGLGLAAGGGRPMHRRVRIAVYAVLLVVGIHTTLHAWQAGRAEHERVENARLADLVASQRWISQSIGRLVSMTFSDASSYPLGQELEALLHRAEEDAERLEAMLAAHGALRQPDTQQLNAAWAAWAAENVKLTSAARALISYAMSEDLGVPAGLVAAVQRQASISLEAAQRLVEALATLTRERQLAAVNQARAWSVLTFMVLLTLALFVAEPAARSVRRQHLYLVERMRELRRLALVAERTTNVVMITDARQHIVWVNEAFRRITGYDPAQAFGRTPDSLIVDPRPSASLERVRDALGRGEGVRAQLPGRSCDGRELWLEFDIQPLHDEGGKLLGFVDVASDVTERRRAQADLRIAAIAFDSVEAIAITDARQVFLKVNPAFTRITGYEPHEAIGRTPRQLMASGRQSRIFYQRLHAALDSCKHWQGELWNRRKNGELYLGRLSITAVTDEEDQVENYVAVLSDITEKRKADETIRNLAYYDPLTELPNRRLLRDRLHQAMSSSASTRRFAAVLFIDLDHFKELNDTRGHDVGDLLLVEVARRLSAGVRSTDTVARQGGDEFVIIVSDLSADAVAAMKEAAAIAEGIRTSLNRPYLLSGYEYHSTPSIGINVFAGHEQRVDELLKRADVAMYQAKRSGRNTLRFFDPETHAAMTERIALEADLRRALPEGQLRLYFQPQVDHDSAIIGGEVLLRWQHPQRGLVSPAHFIGAAEESDLILDIGAWVLERACAQLAAWEEMPEYQQLKLAVNVSARQFRQGDFVAQVRDTVRRAGIDSGRLKLELTESMVVLDIDETVSKMNEIRTLGIGFSMDDFGTGHSSLAYLTRLPLDQLKIDQSFVRKMMVNRSDAVVVQTIVGLARSLSIEAIAEGVETAEQRVFLEAIGCRLFQGYLYGAPMPVEEFAAMLAKHFPRAGAPDGSRVAARA